jgi:hypothetical protein
MYQIIQELQVENTAPALEWSRRNREALIKKGFQA